MPTVYQGVLDAVKIKAVGPNYHLSPTAADRVACVEILGLLGGAESRKRVVGINPGAMFGSSKLWLPERFGLVARALLAAGHHVLLLLGPGEESLGNVVREHAGAGLWVLPKAAPLNTLRAIMERLSLLITNDTGPRHLVVAAGCPVVALVGPTFREWTDWNLEDTTVIQHPVPCGPCHLKTCPLGHECMTSISVEEVLSAALHRLGTPAASR
jgi:heptosyltransferase-2